jgi:Fe-S-cluster containining protein
MTQRGPQFNCQRCGRCCIDLITEDQGILRGLSLLPSEIKDFPRDLIKPAAGIGKDPKGKEFQILLYQLDLSICPHLGEGGCKIYPGRPSSCRQFPYSLNLSNQGNLQLVYDLNCPSLEHLLNPKNISPDSPELRYAQELLKINLELFLRREEAWFYDLESDKWLQI